MVIHIPEYFGELDEETPHPFFDAIMDECIKDRNPDVNFYLFLFAAAGRIQGY